VGEVQPDSLGTYSYLKEMPQAQAVRCRVEVFAMWVDEQLDDWPERAQRTRRWFPLSEAAEKVQEDDLRLLLERLAKQHGSRGPSI
jgi:hypothetical protein